MFWYDWIEIECLKCNGQGRAAELDCDHVSFFCNCFKSECKICSSTGLQPISFKDLNMEEENEE
jgi:hypothetical protein